MKKLMAYLLILCFSFPIAGITSPVNFAAIKAAALQKKEQLLHVWHCAVGPKKPACTQQDVTKGRRWIAGSSLTVLAVVLAAIGIKVRADKLAKIKKNNELKIAAEFALLKEQYDSVNEQIAQAKKGGVAARFGLRLLYAQKQELEKQMQEDFPQQYTQMMQAAGG